MNSRKNFMYSLDSLSKEEYVTYCWDQLEEYLKAILSGSIKSNIWIKWAVERFQNDLKNDKWEFKVESVNKVFKFFYFLKVNTKSGGYHRIVIQPYQVFILANLFGFYNKGTDKRRFDTSFIFIGRKNGKSTFSAAITLYALMVDGVDDPQVLFVANTREQAKNDLDYARGIIFHSPDISKRIEPNLYILRFRDYKKIGYAKIISSIAKKQDGYNPSFVVIDEVHATQTHDMINVMRSGMGFRLNPHIMIITTAGFSLSSVAYDYVEIGKEVLNPNKEQEDDSTFYLLYTLDDNDDPSDESNWIKSNPSMYELIQPHYLSGEFIKAKIHRSQWNNFLTKHLNTFTSESTEWIKEEELKPLFVEKIDPSLLANSTVFTGMDLSATKDLTAVVKVFYNKDQDHYYVVPQFFKAFNLQKRYRKNKDLTPWIDNGYIIECRTETIDFEQIASFIINDLHTYKKFFIKVAYDPFFGSLIVSKLQGAGIPCEAFPQTAFKFNEPLKFIEHLVTNKKITFENPCLLWNFGNAVIKVVDGNGNIKVMKNKCLDAVDGVVALAMAMGMCLSFNNVVWKK